MINMSLTQVEADYRGLPCEEIILTVQSREN